MPYIGLKRKHTITNCLTIKNSENVSSEFEKENGVKPYNKVQVW